MGGWRKERGQPGLMRYGSDASVFKRPCSSEPLSLTRLTAEQFVQVGFQVMDACCIQFLLFCQSVDLNHKNKQGEAI